MLSRVCLSPCLLTQWIPRLVKHRTSFVPFFAISILFFDILIGACAVHASYCRISNIAYNYPSLVNPSQEFSVSTTVTGSCETGENYFVRVDVIDKNSGHVISSSRSHISDYNTLNFNITLFNSVTAPTLATASWNIEIAVVVFYVTTTGLQDSTSMAVRDYSSVSYATIQVGSSQPVPEFAVPDPALLVAFVVATLLSIRSKRMLNQKEKASKKLQ